MCWRRIFLVFIPRSSEVDVKQHSRAGAIAFALSLGAMAIVAAFPSRAAAAPHPFRYEVSVTNLTRGQVFSPAVVATHTARFSPIFVLGQPASSELASVAEDAALDPLVAKLSSDPQVGSVNVLDDAGGPIPPGQTGSVVVEASPWASQISLVGMLVTTNDGFYGLDGATLPRFGAQTVLLEAYDAGSEANTELCSFIPGPPCGSHGVRDTSGAEGFVHVHAGIHGIGDLDASNFDWRNPVALVTIRRLGPGE
jgi:hypothetical protein